MSWHRLVKVLAWQDAHYYWQIQLEVKGQTVIQRIRKQIHYTNQWCAHPVKSCHGSTDGFLGSISWTLFFKHFTFACCVTTRIRSRWNTVSHFRQIQLKIKSQKLIKCICKHITRIRGARASCQVLTWYYWQQTFSVVVVQLTHYRRMYCNTFYVKVRITYLSVCWLNRNDRTCRAVSLECAWCRLHARR